MAENLFELAKGYERVSPIPKLDIDELQEVECIKPVGDDTQLIFYCEPINRYRGVCPKCEESNNHYANGYAKDRTVHDISRGLVSIVMKVKVPRYRCNECGKSFSYPFKSIMPGQQFTRRLYDQLKIRVLKEPFTVVADEYGISDTKAADILLEYSRELFKDRKVIAPMVLGIDEKHIVKEKRGVLVDIQTGMPLEMTPDNSMGTIQAAVEALENYNKNVKVVTIDMWNPYVSVVQECMPYAVIVIDKFHVIANAYRKIGRTKSKLYALLKKEVSEIEDYDERERKQALLTRMGKNVFLFKFGRKRLREEEEHGSLMSELCLEFPEINRLRLLKESFEQIYDEGNRKAAEARYVEWTKLVPPRSETLYSEIHTLSRTMKNWRKYIFNYFDPGCNYTNATTEGVNRRIDSINNEGYGYGFEALRTKVLFNSFEKLNQKPKKNAKKYNFKPQRDTDRVRFAVGSSLPPSVPDEPVKYNSGGGITQ